MTEAHLALDLYDLRDRTVKEIKVHDRKLKSLEDAERRALVRLNKVYEEKAKHLLFLKSQKLLVTAQRLVASARTRAKKQGVEFDLTGSWLADRLVTGKCELSGVVLVPSDIDRVGLGRHPLSPSLDRIDAGGPYTQANTRVVALALNVGMNNWGLEPLLLIFGTEQMRSRTVPQAEKVLVQGFTKVTH